MPARPTRVKIKNELGKTRTLPDTVTSFQQTGQGKEHLVLGLGPEPDMLPAILGHPSRVWFVEHDLFAQQMGQDWEARIPASFQRIPVHALTRERLAASTLWTYTPGLRLFPSFWGPILARIRLLGRTVFQPSRPPVVLLPAQNNALIVPELARAFEQAGWRPLFIPDNLAVKQMEDLLLQVAPTLCLSLNLAGLDGYGETHHLLREAGVNVVVWMVDNPFHILSRCQGHFWKDIPLGVTDDWFMKPLQALGGQAFHLPLATDPFVFHPSRHEHPQNSSPAVTFVGRTSFPRKQQFFAGVSVDASLLNLAKQGIPQGRRRDFAWWTDQLDIPSFWPEKAIRKAGLGAEETALAWRLACLQEAASCCELTLVGDSAWHNLLSRPVTLHPPLDYYTTLGDWYARASITLNMTSMLLPHGLTQRHFDVWAAGGFLLTDTTPGLRIFPEALYEPVAFREPDRLPALIQRFQHDSRKKHDLCQAWQEEIFASHTYAHRVQKILEISHK